MAYKALEANEDYETQVLGYPPTTFFQEINAIINDRLCEGIDLLQEKLLMIPENVLPRDEVNQGIDRLRQHTECSFSKNMKRTETFILENLMKIPPHVLLPSDVDQVTRVTAADINVFQAELDSLHMLIKNEKYMQAKYRQELEDICKVLTEQKKLIEGDLNLSKISDAKDSVEKLKFIQATLKDYKLVCNKMHGGIEDIPLDCGPSSAQLLAEIEMQ